MIEALTNEQKDQLCLVGGFAHPELTTAIADEMGIQVGATEQREHPNGELYTRFEESVRGKTVVIVQSHARSEHGSINDAIQQQIFFANSARSSSASEIIAVAPYLGYSRQDRKAQGRELIGTQAIIDQLVVNGVDHFLSVDMHSAQTQAIYRGPFDSMTAQPLLAEAMCEETDVTPEDCIVIAPDAGAAKMAEKHSERLEVGMAFLNKVRRPGQAISRESRIDGVGGRTCLIFDDMIDTAGSLVSAVEVLKNSGAKDVYVGATHGIFSEPAMERLLEAPLERILITDTVPQHQSQEALGNKLRVVPIAPLIGKTLIQILAGGSVSEVFKSQNYG